MQWVEGITKTCQRTSLRKNLKIKYTQKLFDTRHFPERNIYFVCVVNVYLFFSELSLIWSVREFALYSKFILYVSIFSELVNRQFFVEFAFAICVKNTKIQLKYQAVQISLAATVLRRPALVTFYARMFFILFNSCQDWIINNTASVSTSVFVGM